MPEATFHFPRGFIWGTATASHQVEGNNKNNNWWAWEQEKGHIVHNHKSALACDWWGGRWREDFDRAAEMGQNAHRLSIEWSRIQPAPDRWDEDALDHYRQIVRGLVERGLTPFVTLHHFTDPLWLTERGAWEEDITEIFAAYTRKVVEALREYVSRWCTINEPNVYATLGYVMGIFPPGEQDIQKSFKVMENMLRGHAAAYRVIHQMQPRAQVGMAIHYRNMQPFRPWYPPDRLMRNLHTRLFNDFFPRAVQKGFMRFPLWRKGILPTKGAQDFLGINYYTSDYVAFDPLNSEEGFSKRFFPPDAELSETGFIANMPEGFFEALQWGLQFGVPIYVTENGVEDSNDHLRPRYLAEHIHQMWRAVNYNWLIKAYFHWTLVDNFEWERGWTQRFGLWELDVETQGRRKRTSADFFEEICRMNGLSSEMVARYAPGIKHKMFPG